MTKSSGEDIRTLLHGPVLKINRLSDLSLPFTAEEKKEIARRYKKEQEAKRTSVGPQFEILTALKRSARAFEDYRYIYEFENVQKADSWLCHGLLRVVRNLIVERHPDWKW